MSNWSRFWLVVLVALLCTDLTGQQVDKEWIQGSLRSQAAAAHNVSPERLQASKVATLTFPMTGVVIYTAKFVDAQTGATYQSAVDVNGKAVDPDAAAAQEEKATLQKYGKIDPQLYKLMEQMESGAVLGEFYAQATRQGTIPVSIWVASQLPRTARPPLGDAATAQIILQNHLRDVQNSIAPQRMGVVKALARMGVTAQEPLYAPIVFANLTPNQIRSIAKHVDVTVVYGPQERQLHEDHASTTQRGYRVWSAGNLGGGGTVRPVVHEPDGASDANPYLNNPTHALILYCSSHNTLNCSIGKNLGDHASEVAGVIASTHPLFRGVAPSVQTILSANTQTWNDVDLVNAFEWAHANGGNPTNMSWGTTCPTGQQDLQSRYVDWAVANLWATFTISSGNNAQTAGCPYVASPGMAWAAITVGSQYDNYDGWWGGDGLSSFSAYVNPLTGQDKPEVLAVGESVNSTANATTITTGPVAGTSFSAPQVAGEVALILNRQPYLQIWPEVNKAMVMTSAFHSLGLPQDKQGVGSVVMNVADDSARLGRWGYITFAPTMTDWNATFYGGPLNLTKGHTYRFAIAWDPWADQARTFDQLGADLDLYIYKPDGTLMTASASVANAWEMVQFTAPVTGTYSAKVHKYSSVSGWPGSYLGIAYSDNLVTNLCTGTAAGVGTFNIDTTNLPNYFSSYVGWPYGQTGREYMRKVVVPATGNHTIKVTNTNTNMDLHLVQLSSCTADPPVVTVVAHGNTLLQATVAPGTYYVVADGRDNAAGIGYVGKAALGISLIAP